jgi:hypothetical protein
MAAAMTAAVAVVLGRLVPATRVAPPLTFMHGSCTRGCQHVKMIDRDRDKELISGGGD